MTPVATASGGLRERKKARLRQQILDTSVRLFRSRGYPETTVEQIVGELEISPATFYNYFRSKDAVLAEVARLALERSRELLESKPEQAEDSDSPGTAGRSHTAGQSGTVEQLRAFLDRVSAGVESDRQLWRAIFATGSLNRGANGERRAAATSGFRILERILSEGQARGEITRALPADHLAQVLQGTILKILADYVFDFPQPHTLSRRLSECLALFLERRS
ncbi:MAG: TetR/AcrR family transcriptional regulator [bacterium]|nr:TetR/AcrR family transcriptional regulator [bacterium]